MTETQPLTRTLHDPATGRDVELVYAIPPQLLGESGAGESPGIAPSEVIARLLASWRTIAAITTLGACIGLAVALATPNRFTASATALPPADKSGGGGMLAQYAGLAAAAGVQLPGAPTSSVDAIMAILASRRLHEPLIERFQLRDYYKSTTRDDVLKAFAADFSARSEKKSNTITIAVTHRDAQKAADIANAAADLLKTTYNEINQSTATRERQFLEGRVKQAEADTGSAAKAMAEFQAEKGAVEIESQTKATIAAVAKFQGGLIAQQIELKTLLASAWCPDNPAIQLLQERVKAMTAEMQRLLGAGDGGPGVLLGLGSLPELNIAYIERFRAVKKHEAILTALSAQLEGSRINDVRTNEVITIIDRAFVPERKGGPPRAQICIAATLLGFLFGCCAVLLAPALRIRQPNRPG